MYEAKIIADSKAYYTGTRLATFEITFPRMVLAEFNTHRVFSRNSASSRAIPVQKQIQRVMDDPFIPLSWGKNQKGMQADVDLEGEDEENAIDAWLNARDDAVERATELLKIGVHKQITNRLLEPFMWHTAIVTATELSNFFALRANPMAQPEIRTIAEMMQKLYNEQEPKPVHWNEWHLPYIFEEDREAFKDDPGKLLEISAARCARVSYLTHSGKRDYEADLALYERLASSGHLSPLEHVAAPNNGWHGNFYNWKQLRKYIPNEDDFSKAKKEVAV
jgi:thymidylate synthase ThyX